MLAAELWEVIFMKLLKGKLFGWILLQGLLLLVDIAAIVYIVSNFSELVQTDQLDGWMFRWLLLTVAWIFGTYKVYEWYKQGKFHEPQDNDKQ